ncbi:hypothetical protein IP92_00526 [Pseudoduganella flava]|uniref:Uncharacterized protein n=1 Tax=Pseudoduganella flava TaxID=871742 RepID=A0A562Q454_9BURK|nr:hypothetical protein [Pseudoduganella flava]QGZ41561.1 hypothetical protein GO485_22565 [Pseudoduganella flava]TWI51539.1 hypothetical protein IP92_00526 [Pseudoduganella flava]
MKACMIATAVMTLACAAPAWAQQPSYARMVVIVPKPGQGEQFEKGYERHLQWHRDARDPWTWYGWTFVLGDRIGQFMDGTFGHAAADFDNAVQPAADTADNNVNVVPYADFVSHGMYQRMEALSAGAPLPDTSPFMALTTYQIRPGQEQAFEQAVSQATVRQRDPAARQTWYRLQAGGQAPQYVLLRAVPTFGAAATLGTPYTVAGVVDSVRNELLRYRANLSYRP